MTQYVINIGALPNDGTGDPLRTAFNEVNLNFNQVWATGLVGSNLQIANNTILTTNTNGNLILNPNGVGIIQANAHVLPDQNRIRNLGSSSLRWDSLYVQYANISGNIDLAGSFSVGDLTVGGNLTVTGNTIQIGNITTESKTIQLANAASTANAANGSGVTVGVNDDIATMLYNSTSNTWVMNVGISTGNLILTDDRIMDLYGPSITNADLISGATSGLDLVPNGNTSATTLFNTYGNIQLYTSNTGANVKTFTFDYTGNLTLPSNSANINYANGVSILNGVGSNYGNGNVATFLASFGSNTITTTGNITAGNIVPGTSNIYSLGNATNQWSDLYVSNATIYMNNVPISLTAGNILTVNGDDVVTANANGVVNLGNLAVDSYNIYNTQNQGVIISNFNFVTAEAETAYVQIPAGNSASDLNVVQEQGNVRLVANAAAWSFDTAGTLTLPNNANINSVDGGNITYINSASGTPAYPTTLGLRAYGNTANLPPIVSTSLNSADGRLEIHTYNQGTDTTYDWQFDDGGSLTLPNAPGNIYFGGISNQPVIIPGATAITLNADRGDTLQNYLTVGQDGIDLFSVNTINIENNTTGLTNSDINLRSGDDILLQGRDRPADEEREGGDININGGDGSNASAGGFDPGGGGDLSITSGAGGSGTGTGAWGGAGGFINIIAGDGGSSVDAITGSGGTIGISAGSAQTPSDPANGGFGGSVNISAGTTTRVNETGGSITLTTGASTGLGYGASGYVEINIPSSNVGAGGTWTFGGTGKTFNVPADSEIYGASYGNFTVGCAGNTIVTSSDYGANVKNWVFGYTGNLVVPGPITQNSYDSANLLVATTADTNWAYGFTTNGSTDFYSQIKFFGDSSNTRGAKILDSNSGNAWVFDGTGRLTLPGEGIVQSINDTVILQSVNAGSGNTYSARLGTNGGLYFETTEYPGGWLSLTNNAGNANITAASGTAGGAGKNIYITAGFADQGDFYTTPGGSVNIIGGLGAFNDGGGGGPGGNVNLTAGVSSDPAGHAGNINLTAGSSSWVFDYTGNLTASGNISTAGNIAAGNFIGGGSNVELVAGTGITTFDTANNVTFANGAKLNGGTANQFATDNTVVSSLDLRDTGGAGFYTNGSGYTLRSNGTYNWIFDTAGNLTLPGNTFSVNYANGAQVSLGGGSSYGNSNVATFLAAYGSNTISTSGNITAGNLIGNISITGNVTGTSSNVTLVAGSYSTTFDNAGNVTLANSNVFVGTTNTILPNTVASFSSNINSYTQVTNQNKSTGADATADFILTADNGNDTVNYGDFGIINSGYDNGTPTNSLGNIVFAADTYLYSAGNVGNTSQSGGNLVIGTTTATKTVKIFAGGNTNSALVANISNTGVAINGNLTFTANTNNIVFNTTAYISGNGNTIGRDGSILLVPYTGAGSTFPGVMIGGAGRLLAPNGSVHQIFNANDVTFQVPIKNIVGTAATSTTTGALQITGGAGITTNAYVGGSLVRTGAVSNAAWTTAGVGLRLPTATYTDTTTAAGTQAASYVHAVGAPALAFSNAVTVTNAATLYVAAPTAGTNATITNPWSMIVDGNVQVNGTGAISTPNRPGFRVYGNGVTSVSTTTNTNGVLNGNNWAADYNQGSYLDNTTGTFTAPVAGLYQVNLNMRVANNIAPTAQAIVVKNRATTNTAQAMWESAANCTVNHFGVSTVSKLAVGDTLNLVVAVGALTFDQNDSWSVAFLG